MSVNDQCNNNLTWEEIRKDNVSGWNIVGAKEKNRAKRTPRTEDLGKEQQEVHR
jgi:hypothetical protein